MVLLLNQNLAFHLVIASSTRQSPSCKWVCLAYLHEDTLSTAFCLLTWSRCNISLPLLWMSISCQALLNKHEYLLLDTMQSLIHFNELFIQDSLGHFTHIIWNFQTSRLLSLRVQVFLEQFIPDLIHQVPFVLTFPSPFEFSLLLRIHHVPGLVHLCLS